MAERWEALGTGLGVKKGKGELEQEEPERKGKARRWGGESRGEIHSPIRTYSQADRFFHSSKYAKLFAYSKKCVRNLQKVNQVLLLKKIFLITVPLSGFVTIPNNTNRFNESWNLSYDILLSEKNKRCAMRTSIELTYSSLVSRQLLESTIINDFGSIFVWLVGT